MAKNVDLVTGRGAAPDSGAGGVSTPPTPAETPVLFEDKKAEAVEPKQPTVAPAREDADIIKGSHLVGTTGVRVHDVEPGHFKIIGGNWGYKGKCYYSGCTYPVGTIDIEVLKKFPKQIVVGG